MELPKKLVLPKLLFNFNSLEPCISEETIISHYLGHHKNYVYNYNKAIDSFDLSFLYFNLYGHLLHSGYWNSLIPIKTQPGPRATQILFNSGFLTKQDFDKELIEHCINLRGSGWVAVTNDGHKIHFETISNNDFDLIKHPIIFIIDVFEHAYYLDYKFKKIDHYTCLVDRLNWIKAESLL